MRLWRGGRPRTKVGTTVSCTVVAMIVGTIPAQAQDPAATEAVPNQVPNDVPNEPSQAVAAATAKASTPPSRLVPNVVLAVGLAATVAGSVMWALDEDRTPDPRVKTYFDSAPAGVTLLVGGAVATGVGIYLWARVRAQERARAPRTTVVISPARGGAVIGISAAR